jgi:hypothetical protein
MLTPPPYPPDPAARVACRIIFAEIANELQRRIALHQNAFQKVWGSTEYTAQEFFDECGDQGEKFLSIAGANVSHIAVLAVIDGKTLNDLIDPSEYIPPVAYTVNGGVVTLSETP